MKLIVLGATGGTGLQIVERALERGHSVTAFARSPDRLRKFGGRIKVVLGNLLHTAEMEQAIAGHDAILSGFGPRFPIAKGDANLLERFAATLTGAMAHAGVNRVVVESTAFLFKDAIVPPANLVGRLFFPGVVNDAAAMEGIFEKSRLAWTLVRPPRLTDGKRKQKYRVREGHLPNFGFVISRADVADFMVGAAESGSYIGRVVGVCN